MSSYFRPILRFGAPRPDDAVAVAGGPGWFTRAVRHDRDGSLTEVSAGALPAGLRDAIAQPRAAIAGLDLAVPRLMGILNVTPDSFSDGGQHDAPAIAVAHGRKMVAAGADLVDIGGESTRPGAAIVPAEAEIARTEPVIAALAGAIDAPVSIDTRKAVVARAAIGAGARMVNDVSGFTHDADLGPLCAGHGLPVCVMHARGTPQDMQDDPRYDDVLLDVYDWLEARIAALEAEGLPRSRIVVDPGIGFGKTLAHNLALLRGLSLFHGLGCAILLGASRKGLIGQLSGAQPASARAPGSIAAALVALRHGVQILRVHDVAETRQALDVWLAIERGRER